MAKSQKRSNKEAKKPKAVKLKPVATSSASPILQNVEGKRKPAKATR